jgi:WD40 repeat protein
MFLTASTDMVVRLWDRRSLALLKEFRGHKSSVFAVFFSSDGKTLMSASTDEVRSWRCFS